MANGIFGPFSAPRDWLMSLTGSGKVDHLSDKDLRALLAGPNRKGPLREKAIEKLIKRIEAKISFSQATNDDLRQTELLRKLRDGTITEQENDEVGNLMSVALPRLNLDSGQTKV